MLTFSISPTEEGSNATSIHRTNTNHSGEEEEDALTQMFKSFAFERAQTNDEDEQTPPTAEPDDMRARNQRVGEINEFEAMWGESQAQSVQPIPPPE